MCTNVLNANYTQNFKCESDNNINHFLLTKSKIK